MAEGARCIEIIGGYSALDLAGEVAREVTQIAAAEGLDVEVDSCFPVRDFACHEILADIPHTVRGSSVYAIGSHAYHERPDGRLGSPQDALWEHRQMLAAARDAWAARVIAVAPYMGFGRQERRTGRQTISARMALCDLSSAADGVIAVDMHASSAEGYSNRPFEHLTATPLLRDRIRSVYSPTDGLVVVSPDNGRSRGATRLRDSLLQTEGWADAVDLAVIDKRRIPGTNRAEVLGIMMNSGSPCTDVRGRPCVIFDDMIDGAGTVTVAAEALSSHGASDIAIMATHGVFSKEAPGRLNASPADRLIVTDTIPLSPEMKTMERLRPEIITVAPFLARAILATEFGQSISAIHDGVPQRV